MSKWCTSKSWRVAACLILAALSMPPRAEAQAGIGGGYTQDFNTLANSGTSSTVPTGWAFSESGTNSNTTYTAGTGSSNAGDTYSFGATSNSERAFGGLRSGTLIPTIGAQFNNNTGQTVGRLLISYTGEQWRLGATGRVDRLDFQYSLDATSLTTGTWTDVDTLDFTAPVTSGSVGALNGNDPANQVNVGPITISGLSIGNGTNFWIRWNDLDATGSDDGLSVDTFALNAQTPTAITLMTFTADASPAGRLNPLLAMCGLLVAAGLSLRGSIRRPAVMAPHPLAVRER